MKYGEPFVQVCGRAGFFPASDRGDVLSLATLVLLVALCFVRGRLKAPDS